MNTTQVFTLLLVVSSSWTYAADKPEADKNKFRDAIVKIPQMTRPGYLEPYIDPVFGSKVTRITGDPGTPIMNIDSVWNPVARHNYSKIAAWNANQSLLLLGKHHGFPSMLFLDGKTFKPVFGRNTSPGTEIRWHPSRPDQMVFVKENSIGYWGVRKEMKEMIATFDGYSDFHIGPWEGNLSHDGRMIVVDSKKGADHIAFAYDLEKRRKYPDIIINNVHRDFVTISASGKYIVLNGKITSPKGDQTQVFDLNGRKIGKLWEDYGRPSHFDLTVDADGQDIAVGVSKSKPDNGRVIKRRLHDGKVTLLTLGGYADHTSTRNINRPGWAYVTYQHSGPTWPPYWNEILAVKLDGSMKVQRIAHMRTLRTDYLTEAHASPSPDGRFVIWASTWNGKSGRPISAYVAEIKTPDN